MAKYQLTLYISGTSANSARAVENIRQTCETLIPDDHEIRVIDVLVHPELAEQDKVLATPTLVRHKPLPVRKIIGDLSDRERVLMALDLYSAVTDPRADTSPS